MKILEPRIFNTVLLAGYAFLLYLPMALMSVSDLFGNGDPRGIALREILYAEPSWPSA